MQTKNTQFILRRLHSLTGMAPMGLFLFEHFFTNSYSHQGPEVYNAKVHFLTSLPFLFFIEWGLLFTPFLYHIFYGLYIMYTGAPNVGQQSYQRNWLYFLQRLSAIPAMAFIFYHVASTRFAHHGDPNFYGIMAEKFTNPLMVAFYIVGIVSICFHFANGIATFLMSWGVTVSPRSQKIVGFGCVGVGVFLTYMAIWSMLGFKVEPGAAPEKTEPAAEHAEHAGEKVSQAAPGLEGFRVSFQG